MCILLRNWGKPTHSGRTKSRSRGGKIKSTNEEDGKRQKVLETPYRATVAKLSPAVRSGWSTNDWMNISLSAACVHQIFMSESRRFCLRSRYDVSLLSTKQSPQLSGLFRKDHTSRWRGYCRGAGSGSSSSSCKPGTSASGAFWSTVKHLCDLSFNWHHNCQAFVSAGMSYEQTKTRQLTDDIITSAYRGEDIHTIRAHVGLYKHLAD